MRRFSLLSLTSASLLLSLPAIAAEPGTYRPGKVYSSVPASHAQLCESQCQGDAQCRTWNFVKVNERQASGVCELNSNSPRAISSPVSISGLGQTTSAISSSKIISGGTNTIRIGQGNAFQSAPTVTQAINQQARPNRVQPPRRKIVREPIPQRIDARQSAYRPHPQSLTHQQNLQRQHRQSVLQTRPQIQSPNQTRFAPRQAPRFQHNLEANPQNQTRPNIANRQQNYAARPPQPGINPSNRPVNRQAAQGADPRLLELQRRQNAQFAHIARPVQNQRPQIGTPYGQRPQIRAPQAQRPQARPPQAQGPQAKRPQVQRPQVQAPQKRPQAAPRSQSPQAMIKLPAERAQDSLFGSLYDDVIVPAPINAEEFSNNPDVPLATVKAVPTIPVTTENLAGLAGAAPQ